MKIPCTYCGTKLDSERAFFKHVQRHTKAILCDRDPEKCFYVARNDADYENHVSTSHLPPRKQHMCDVDNCGSSFATLRSLSRHFPKHHPTVPVAVGLALCGVKEEVINSLLAEEDQNQ